MLRLYIVSLSAMLFSACATSDNQGLNEKPFIMPAGGDAKTEQSCTCPPAAASAEDGYKTVGKEDPNLPSAVPITEKPPLEEEDLEVAKLPTSTKADELAKERAEQEKGDGEVPEKDLAATSTPAPEVKPAPPQENEEKTDEKTLPDYAADLRSMPAEDNPVASEVEVEVYYVASAGLNVRQAPSMKSKVVRALKRGDKVTGLGREGIWVRIGESEYVSINYLRDKPLESANKPLTAR